MAKIRKLIAEWSKNVQVGIYDNCTETVRLYQSTAIYHYFYVRSSGSLDHTTERIFGKDHKRLLDLAQKQMQDGVDYTHEAIEICAHRPRTRGRENK
jgi:hypothetical protein